jgi:hypothetical protein
MSDKLALGSMLVWSIRNAIGSFLTVLFEDCFMNLKFKMTNQNVKTFRHF